MTKLVYDFGEGNRTMVDLLGGKGANLAEMTRLGLPVPAGFTITTQACTAFLSTGSLPGGLIEEVSQHLPAVEAAMGERLGDASDPFLLSVRSGARYSMPGMMETILDIGLTDDSVEGLARHSGDPRFAWDSYRRLIQMFGRTVAAYPLRTTPRCRRLWSRQPQLKRRMSLVVTAGSRRMGHRPRLASSRRRAKRSSLPLTLLPDVLTPWPSVANTPCWASPGCILIWLGVACGVCPDEGCARRNEMSVGSGCLSSPWCLPATPPSSIGTTSRDRHDHVDLDRT
jgi:hypothetical protein